MSDIEIVDGQTLETQTIETDTETDSGVSSPADGEAPMIQDCEIESSTPTSIVIEAVESVTQTQEAEPKPDVIADVPVAEPAVDTLIADTTSSTTTPEAKEPAAEAKEPAPKVSPEAPSSSEDTLAESSTCEPAATEPIAQASSAKPVEDAVTAAPIAEATTTTPTADTTVAEPTTTEKTDKPTTTDQKVAEPSSTKVEEAAPTEQILTPGVFDDSVLQSVKAESEELLTETYFERFCGLAEMFPKGLRSGTVTAAKGVKTGAKGSFSLLRQVSWILSVSVFILAASPCIEAELSRAQESIAADRNRVMLGPGYAMSQGPQSTPASQ